MPPRTLLDLSAIDLNKVAYDQEFIRTINPQRGDMEHLNAIVHVDGSKGDIIGYKDVSEKEFWVPGHIPGRPLLPGVIMIEAGAQLCSFYTKVVLKLPGFIGFGGLEDCKFRAQVVPGNRLYLLGHLIWHRHGRIASSVQGLVNGNIAFDATIIGVQM
jgi:3-hydroxyacyl-[acyl-carrier-protein] dehydratase